MSFKIDHESYYSDTEKTETETDIIWQKQKHKIINLFEQLQNLPPPLFQFHIGGIFQVYLSYVLSPLFITFYH